MTEEVIWRPYGKLRTEAVPDTWVERDERGKIRVHGKNRAEKAVAAVLISLSVLTVIELVWLAGIPVDFKKAAGQTLHNLSIVFFQPRLHYASVTEILYQLLVTFCLGVLSTLFGSVLALLLAMGCARNIADPRVSGLIKGFAAIIRAIPTVIWVLIFAVSAGLGSVAAVIGLTFHSMSYLTKMYAEAIEEMEEGPIEALKASGAGFLPIICQAVLPTSMRYLMAWTFMRFEINFTNAVAMGAAAGAGGIGYNLFMAGDFYMDLHEMGFLTYAILLAVICLEKIATKVKKNAS